MNNLHSFSLAKGLRSRLMLVASLVFALCLLGEKAAGQGCNTPFIRRIGSAGPSEIAYKIIAAPDGNLLIGGNKGNAALLMSVTPLGDIVWERTFDFNYGPDFIYDMIIDSEGKLVAVGRDQINTNTLCFIMRYDLQTNTVLWAQKLPDPTYTRLEGLKELPNHNYLVHGMTNHSGNLDNLIMEVNKTNGAQVWLKSYNNGQTDIFFDAIIHGNACYTSNVQRYGGLDKLRASVSKLDLNGNQVWTRNYIRTQAATARMYADALDIVNDTLVILGHGNLSSGDEINYTLQLSTADLDGKLRWAKNYQFAGGLTIIGNTLIPVPDGYILEGTYTKSSKTEIFIMKVNKQGNTLWAKAVGSAEDESSRSAIVHNGYIYFTGASSNFDINQDILYGKMSLNGEVLGAGCSYVKDLQVTVTDFSNPFDGLQDMIPVTANHPIPAIATAPIAVASPIDDIAGCGCQIVGTCNNLLPNPGFENSLAGWSVTGEVSTTSDAHAGSLAAKICGAGNGSVGQISPAQAGQAYTGTAWAKSDNPPNNANAQLRFLNASYTPLATGNSQQSIATNGYNQYNLQGVAPAGTAYVHFMIWKQGSACVTIDDMELCNQSAAPSLPDLTVSNISVPILVNTTLQGGSTMPVTFTLSNLGTGVAPSGFDIKIYMSSTPNLTQSSMLVKTLPQQSLVAGGASLNLSSNPVVPNNITPGSYYVVVIVDEANTVAESDETNNTAAISQAFTVYGSCAMEANVTQVWCGNNGTPGITTDDLTNFTISAINTNLSIGYYLNVQPTNQNLNIGYGVTLDITGPPISAGNLTLVLTDVLNPSCTKTLSVTAPPSCSPGLPDLVPSNLIVPSSVNANGSYPFNFTVTNNGNVPVSGPSGLNNSLFLSTDNQFDNTDVYVGGSSGPYNFPANSQQQYGPLNLLIPAVSAGNYFLILFVDQSNKVTESDEANNKIFLPVTVQNAPSGGGIDLSLAVTSPATAPIYTSYPTAIKITNSGSIPATGVKVVCQKPSGVVYTGGNESTTTQGTFEALTTQVWTVGTLAPGASATLTVNYFLLQATLPAVYAQVTAANETDPDSTPNNGTPPTPNEDDEASSAGTTPPPPVQPDLTLTDLIAPASTPPGPATFTFTLKNVGNAAVQGNYQIGAFLSTDNVLSSDDYSFTAISEQNTAVGSFNRTGSIAIPTGQAGNYFLILKADAGSTIAESNEGNNTVFRALTITGTPVQQPDLQLGSLNAPANLLPNTPTSIEFQLSNTGTVPVQGSFQTDIFLSTDNVISANDQLLLSMPEQNMIIGSVSRTASISVGSAISAGNYYLLLKVDAGNIIAESNESNNVLVQSLTVTTSGGSPDCNAITITPGMGNITIAGVNAPHAIIKVFKPNWALAFECLDGSCASPQVVTGLGTGSHYVEIKLMNANWGEICTKTQNVGVSNLVAPKDDRMRLNLDRFYPNPAKYTVTMDVFSPEEQNATFDFYDQQGRLFHSMEVFLEKGQNQIEQFVFDWKSGTYNVIARGEETGLPAYGRFLKVWEE